MKGANCILELLQEGQQAQSLRYFEAVTQNKKLLTNNRHVSELPYFDSRWMRYFERVDDIDPTWVKRREPVDYGYKKGEFSPLGILLFLEENGTEL